MKPDAISPPSTRVENELLLCLVRPVVSEVVSNRIDSLLNQRLDWDYLLAAAQQHRVTPLFQERLRPHSVAVPDEIWSELQKRRRQISEVNFGLTSKLLKLTSLLRDHDVRVMSYKGPALAQSAYGDIGLRHFIDLDIIVHQRDVLKVKEIFLANGCEPAWVLTAAQETAVLRHYYEYPIVCNDRKVLVEVHWDFAESFFSFAFDFDQMWERLDTLMILGKSILTPSVEDSLLVLCAHGNKHCWERLGWVCDVAQLVSRRTDLNWELLSGRAAALGLSRMLWVGLRLASDMMGIELPPEIAQKLAGQQRITELASELQRGVFDPEAQPTGTVAMTRLQLRLRERFKDRFNYCFRLIVMTKLIDSLFMPMGRPR